MQYVKPPDLPLNYWSIAYIIVASNNMLMTGIIENVLKYNVDRGIMTVEP